MQMKEVLTHLLGLFAGTGVFLIACDIMSKNLEAASSDKLKEMFAKVSDNKLIGVLIGCVATIAIQSSSAMAVMAIGFVNAGIITINQAAAIIFGGEIGTTVTGQIVALGMHRGTGFDPTVVFGAFCGLGVFAGMFLKDENHKRLADIMAGFGLLFIGLEKMSGSMEAFAAMEELKTFLAGINSTVLIIVAGAILTALIQSSSAMTSIAIAMVSAGLVSIEQGIYLTLGANIGTCVTGMLAALKSGINAKRTSLLQLIFNCGGVVLLALIDSLIKVFSSNSVSVSLFFEKVFANQPQTQLAMFHTVFNVASVALVLPICDGMVSLCTKLVPGEEEEAEEERFYFIDENMLKTPSIAVDQVRQEILHMADTAHENFNIAMHIIQSQDYARLEEFRANERELNFLNKNLVSFVVELCGRKGISHKDYLYLTSSHKVISDFERIGDYSENIIEYAEELKKSDDNFSTGAMREIKEVQDLINELYGITMEVYKGANHGRFQKAKDIENLIDVRTRQMGEKHITRLNEGICSAVAGAQFLKLANDVERIGDHLINVNDKDYVISH